MLRMPLFSAVAEARSLRFLIASQRSRSTSAGLRNGFQLNGSLDSSRFIWGFFASGLRESSLPKAFVKILVQVLLMSPNGGRRGVTLWMTHTMKPNLKA